MTPEPINPLFVPAMEKLIRVGGARNRDVDREPRTVSITDDEALAIVREFQAQEAAMIEPDPEPQIAVRYSVMVYATIDLALGTVERVVVDDDNVSQPLGVSWEDYETTDPVPEDLAERARQIAESESWPKWEFGW
jgi:hypothetical protein